MRKNVLKSKKGFTLVEMIVVLVIIGVLSAILIPLGITIWGSNDQANTYAKNFYYAVQEVATDIRLEYKDQTTQPIQNGATLLIYMQMNDKGEVVGDVTAKYDTTKANLGVGGGASLSTDIVSNLKTRLGKLMSHNERNGFYYAIVDDKYRVTAAYWSDGAYDNLKDKSFTLTADYRVGDYKCGAYPVTEAQNGESFFA